MVTLPIQDFHLLWCTFPSDFLFSYFFHVAVLLPLLTPKRRRFGLFRVRSPLLTESQLFSLPAGTKMFQFPAFASYCRITGLQPVGLPHSGMSGLTVVCTYPNLFAAYHALHRLIEPRYPPFALNLFSYFISDCFDEIDYLLLKAAYKQMNFTLLVKNESSNNLFDVM